MILQLKNICKTFNRGTVNETTLFHDFNFEMEQGEYVSIVGSNGSGKTTLLNIICGSLPIDSGHVMISGQDVTHRKDFRRYKKIGRVYQNPSMGTCPRMTVLENMALADNKGKPWNLGFLCSKKKIDSYREMLSDLGLGLEDRMQVRVGALSGGQRQAMSLLMTTMTPLDFLILDEHTAALDPKTSETIMQLTDRIIREKNLTALMVTHNLRYAAEYGSRLIMMHEGHCIMDLTGDDKKNANVDTLLSTFYEISIETGN